MMLILCLYKPEAALDKLIVVYYLIRLKTALNWFGYVSLQPDCIGLLVPNEPLELNASLH